MPWGRPTPTAGAEDGQPKAPLSGADRDAMLLALVAQTEQLNERLTRLENRFDARLNAQDPEPTDLYELRQSSARLAAELHRVTLELRSNLSTATFADDPTKANEPETGDLDLTEPNRRTPGTESPGWYPLND